MSMEFSLVFGATGVIGKEFCKALAKRGENLVISSRYENKLQLLKNEITALNDKIEDLTLALDLTSSEDRINAFSKLRSLGVLVKGLYYVSGIDTRKAFIKYDQDKLTRQARVNFEGALSTTKFAFENRAQKLDILVVSSACGLTPMPYFQEYSATKSALIYFDKGLKKDLNDKTVKITLLCPGSVEFRGEAVVQL